MSKLSDHFQQTLHAHLFTPKEMKRYNLLLIPKIIDRMEQQKDCQECRDHLQKVPELVAMLHEIRSDRSIRRKFRKVRNIMERHLASKHKIVRKGYYAGMFIAFGVAMGTSFMAALDSPAGIAIGIGIGVAIGSSLDKKAEKEGRVL